MSFIGNLIWFCWAGLFLGLAGLLRGFSGASQSLAFRLGFSALRLPALPCFLLEEKLHTAVAQCLLS